MPSFPCIVHVWLLGVGIIASGNSTFIVIRILTIYTYMTSNVIAITKSEVQLLIQYFYIYYMVFMLVGLLI